MLAYALIFSAWSLALHARLDTGIFDLGIHVQSMWLRWQGLPDFLTTRGLSTLSDHFTPILYLLAPLGEARTVLILQSFCLASGAYPMYRLARHDLGQERPALGFALAYLLQPGLWSANLFDFHASALATPLLLWALWALYSGRLWLYWSCLLLTLTLGEALGVSIALLAGEAWRAGRRGSALATLLLGLTGLAVAQFVMAQANHGQPSHYRALYAGIRILPLDWLRYLAWLFLPLAFLPLGGWPRLLPALPVILGNLLSWREGQRALDHHYLATLLPFLMWAAVAGYRRRPLGAGWLLALAALNLVLHGSQLLLALQRPPDLSALAQIPAAASVSADNGPGAHLSERAQIYLFPNPFQAVCWGHRPESLVETVGEAGHPPLPGELRRRLAACAVDYLVLQPGDSWPLRQADKAYWLSELRRLDFYRELPGGVFQRRQPGPLRLPPAELNPRLCEDGSRWVFVRDGQVVYAGAQSETVLAPGRQPDISRDGRAVVFVSESSDLVPGDDNACADVFLWRDGRLSRHPGPTAVAQGTPWWPRFQGGEEWVVLGYGPRRAPPEEDGLWLGPVSDGWGTVLAPDGSFSSRQLKTGRRGGLEPARVGASYQLFLDQKQLTRAPDDCLEPCRVGDRLVYTEFYGPGSCRVHLLDLSGEVDRVVGEGYNPCLSGDGAHIIWEEDGRLRHLEL